MTISLRHSKEGLLACAHELDAQETDSSKLGLQPDQSGRDVAAVDSNAAV